jgi:hypothetical protein
MSTAFEHIRTAAAIHLESTRHPHGNTRFLLEAVRSAPRP